MKSNIIVGPAQQFTNISILLESVLGDYEGPECLYITHELFHTNSSDLELLVIHIFLPQT